MNLFDKTTSHTQTDAYDAGYADFSSHTDVGSVPPIGGNVTVYRPKNFNEVTDIIRHLRDGSPAIVYLETLSDATVQRVTDILFGAIVAIGGSMYPIQPFVYIYTPGGVDVHVGAQQPRR